MSIDTAQTRTSSEGEPSSATGRFVDLLLQALPAVGGTIGFVGFVAVIGGAIEWIRFRAAELPADQAVQVVPREQLVTIGAVSMVLFTLLGLMAVLTAYLIDRRGDASAPTWRGVVALSGAGLIGTVIVADLSWWAVAAIVTWVVAVGLLSVGTLDRAAQRWLIRRRTEPQTLRALLDASAELDAAEARFLRARDELEGPHWPGDLEPLAVAERRAANQFWVSIRELERVASKIVNTDDEPAQPADAPPSPQGPDRLGGRALGRMANEAREVAERARGIAAPPADERVLHYIVKRVRYLREKGLVELLRLEWRALVAGGCVGALGGTAALLASNLAGEYWLIPLGLLPLVAAGLKRKRLFTSTLTAIGVVYLLAFAQSQWLVIMVVVVAVLASAILAVAHVTSRFAWYGIAVFIAVQLFGATLEAIRIARFPQLQPVALVRKSDDIGICGVYITQTSERIYLGHVEVNKSDRYDADVGSGRIFWVPRNDVDVVSLGPLMDIHQANARAAAMLDEVYKDRAAEVPARLKPTQSTEETKRETTVAGGTRTHTSTKVTEGAVDEERPQSRPAGTRTPPDCNSIDVEPLS
jgi:hypothetical protein